MKEKWKATARAHDNCQPFIKDAIVEVFQCNPAIGFASVETAIDGWCTQNTIYRWLSSVEGYGTYTERVIPLITDDQK